MDIKTQLKTLIQEAELYREQGLIAEARTKYHLAVDLINRIANLKSKANLLASLEKKIQSINETKEKVEKGPKSPELSAKAQDLIKNLFVAPQIEDRDAAALEGAVILAKFGQFDRAVTEFTALLNRENIRVEAAKNILQCHLAMSTRNEAVAQYHQWFASDLFSTGQLETVRAYLEDILKKKGVVVALPSPDKPSGKQIELESIVDTENQAEIEEEFLDITSIGITFETGPRKGKMVEFDVNFQSGNMLSLIISKKDHALVQDLKAGMKLMDVQFYSPIAIFNGVGVISSKTEIKSGPKQGDYCLDIRIISS